METSDLYQKLGLAVIQTGVSQGAPSKRQVMSAYNIGGQLPPVDPPNFGGGDGDDWMSDLVTRVAVLETHVEHVRSDLEKLSSVPKDLAVLTTNVGHLPTKGWMITGLLGSLALIAALIAYAEKIQSWVS